MNYTDCWSYLASGDYTSPPLGPACLDQEPSCLANNQSIPRANGIEFKFNILYLHRQWSVRLKTIVGKRDLSFLAIGEAITINLRKYELG